MTNTRLWLRTIIAGFALVSLAFVAVLLVMDKAHFGWLMGWAFLPVITGAVIVGGVMMLIGTLCLPQRKSWRGAVLIAWAVIAVTSPLFGLFLFLLPWTLLAVTAPLVIWVLAGMRRESLTLAAAR
jgi:hypothetical protein